MNVLYIEKLIRLIKANLIVKEDIKDLDYKAEVESRMAN